MTCPHCTTLLPDDDRFCEACGEKLFEDAPQTDVLATDPDAPTPPAPPGAVCTCGAPESEWDEEGFCSQCGRRCRPDPEDHTEQEISPEFAAVSDRGKQHTRNEDRFQIAAAEDERAILIVCDGVSSSSNAETAAATGAQTVLERLQAGDSLVTAVDSAREAVATLASAAVRDVAPSSTLVAAVVQEHKAEICWLGDSRAYWISESDSRQLTNDHSWLNEVVFSGEMTYEQASEAPQAHAITRWMGADAPRETRAERVTFEIPGSGWLLFCTDGLWNYTPEAPQLRERVLAADAEASTLEVARQLVAFANESGGKDNITVALLRFR